MFVLETASSPLSLKSECYTCPSSPRPRGTQLCLTPSTRCCCSRGTAGPLLTPSCVSRCPEINFPFSSGITVMRSLYMGLFVASSFSLPPSGKGQFWRILGHAESESRPSGFTGYGSNGFLFASTGTGMWCFWICRSVFLSSFAKSSGTASL